MGVIFAMPTGLLATGGVLLLVALAAVGLEFLRTGALMLLQPRRARRRAPLNGRTELEVRAGGAGLVLAGILSLWGVAGLSARSWLP